MSPTQRRPDTERRGGASRIDLEGSHSGKLDRVINRQTGKRIRGFDVTLLPGDYGTKCDVEAKCMKRVGHDGKCWPNGRFGESST